MTELQALLQVAIDTIIAAFPVGVPPTADEMQNDHCPECTETAARFVGKRWPDVGPSDLQWLAIPLLPPAMPVAGAVHQMWLLANAENGPGSDFTEITKIIERWAGVEVRSKKK